MTISAASFVVMVLLVLWGLAAALWAAPTPTARSSPTGIKLPDGYQSKITIGSNVVVNLFEKTTKPPGLDSGEPIDTTTMFNSKYRTFKLRQLITLTPVDYKCAYDPSVITDLLGQVGQNLVITQSFYDGSTVAYWGGIQKFVPEEMEEGKMPMATVTIVPTNTDNSGAEQAPVVASVAGS
jgi:hypothetical protein